MLLQRLIWIEIHKLCTVQCCEKINKWQISIGKVVLHRGLFMCTFSRCIFSADGGHLAALDHWLRSRLEMVLRDYSELSSTSCFQMHPKQFSSRSPVLLPRPFWSLFLTWAPSLPAGPSGTNIIIGSVAGAILLAAIVLGGTGWGFK